MVAFEAITNVRALTTHEEVLNCASSAMQYPWERPAAEQPPEWRRSRLRATLEPCLAREAAARPSAAALHAAVVRLAHLSATYAGNSSGY